MDAELNRILHQPIRTRIMALLAAQGSCDYTTIKKEFDLSDGHMTTHMKELLGNKYVRADKRFINKKPKTTYHITKKGRAEFAEYVNNLRRIIELE